MLKNIRKVFTHSEVKVSSNIENAYKQQAVHFSAIWNGHSYGIERLARLFICVIQFIYPTILVRSLFGIFGPTTRKLAVEFYIFLKVVFPLWILSSGSYRDPVIIVLILYLLSETILHILNLIFLSDIHEVVVSYHRSVLLLFFNYLETVLDFAIIYAGLGLLNKPVSALSAIYYSFVTQATLGYGDYYPVSRAGQITVILQLIIVILFALLFINYFSARINTKKSED